MTEQQVERFYGDIVALWAGDRETTTWETKIWHRVLLKMDKTIAEQARDVLYERRGKIKYDDLAKLMPAFREEYLALVPPPDYKNRKRKGCPCCNYSGFILLENFLTNTVEALFCHCINKVNKKHDDVCDNLNCQYPEHTGVLRVARGYHQHRHWEVAGFKQCKFHPGITETKNLNLPVKTKEEKITINILHTAGVNVSKLISPTGE